MDLSNSDGANLDTTVFLENADCGKYANAAKLKIAGNGNKVFDVVKILPEDLTDPSAANAAPDQKDNTMTVETACAFNAMKEAAKKSGVDIKIQSAFRTIKRQQYFWNCYQTKSCNNGNLAAKPGTSNHGIGRALDVNTDGRGTRVYKWLASNGAKFGFKETVPGEDWHWELVDNSMVAKLQRGVSNVVEKGKSWFANSWLGRAANTIGSTVKTA